MDKLDKGLIYEFVLILIVSTVLAFFSYENVADKKDAIQVVVTVYSVMAGFLVAVITLVGDPSSLPVRGGWKSAQKASRLVEVRLEKQRNLFYVYLLTLALIFLDAFVEKEVGLVKDVIRFLYVFLSYVACYYSFKLPSSLIAMQKERIENEIVLRREMENIRDH